MKLEVLTPTHTIVQTNAKYITIPSSTGELGIMEGHSTLLTKLNSGVLSYQKGDTTTKLAVHFGFAEIKDDHITVLADLAETPDKIDVERAKKAQADAEKALGSGDFGAEEIETKTREYTDKLFRSMTRQELVK